MTHNFSDDELNYLTPEDDKGKDEDGERRARYRGGCLRSFRR